MGPSKVSVRALADDYLPDVRAGLSVAGLLVPESIAYSTIANLPPQTGVIALLAGLVAYGLLGTSRFAIVSATSSSAAVLAAVVVGMAGGNLPMRMLLAAGLVLITGLIFVGASLARLGGASEFIAKPVLRGYAFGLAIIIIVRQIPSVLGVSLKHSDFAGILIELAHSYAQWNVWQLVTGLIALVLLFAFGRSRQVPGAFVVIALGIVASRWLGLHAHGVSVVGAIDLSGETPSLPSLDHRQWTQLGEFAFALALILYAESYSSIRTFALKHGDLTEPQPRVARARGCESAVRAISWPAGRRRLFRKCHERSGWCTVALRRLGRRRGGGRDRAPLTDMGGPHAHGGACGRRLPCA